MLRQLLVITAIIGIAHCQECRIFSAFKNDASLLNVKNNFPFQCENFYFCPHPETQRDILQNFRYQHQHRCRLSETNVQHRVKQRSYWLFPISQLVFTLGQLRHIGIGFLSVRYHSNNTGSCNITNRSTQQH